GICDPGLKTAIRHSSIGWDYYWVRMRIDMTSNPRRYQLLALVVLFLAACLLVDGIHHTYMHPDEYLVYRFTRADLGYTISYLAGSDTHPPLWFSFFWGWRQVVGSSEFAGRMQAVLFSLIALAVLYQIGRTWFKSPRYGIFAMVCLSVLALFYQYALEIRPYGLVILLASLSMFTFERWLARQSWHWGIFYAVVTAAILYVHYFLATLIIAQGLYYVWGLLRQPSRQKLLQAAGVAGLAFLLWLPWVPSLLNQLKNLRNAELVGGNARGMIGAGTTTAATSLETIGKLAQVATNGQVLLYGVVLLTGVALLWRRAHYRLALVWALGVPAVSLTLNTVAAIYSPRYILSFIIGLALVLGAALASLPHFRWAALVLFAGVSLWALPAQLPKDRIPFREIVKTFAASAQAGDVLYYQGASRTDDVWRWELSQQFKPDWGGVLAASLAEAQAGRRVWFITANWFDDQIQADFRALEQTHPLQQVIGDCNRYWCWLVQRLDAPPWTEPRRFGEQLAFWGADIDAVSPEKISTRLWWKVTQSPPLNYSIGLQLLDTQGGLVAQNDGSIRHFRDTVVETSQLEPDKIYVDFRDLILPADLPPGDYRLTLIVYDWQTGERLLLADGSDTLLLDTINFP
ncbi:MAG TPA: glycosyltransferase family 39 protein, partial [Phototrophicaceae bacterium]|nr:glycosyltransferase family 39 protein [Phototrophicaceae bacterium]